MAVPAVRRLVAIHGSENVCVVVRGKMQGQFLHHLVSPALYVIERGDGSPTAQLRLWWRLVRMRPSYILAPMLSQRRLRLTYFALLFSRTQVPSDFIDNSLLKVRPASICLEDYEGHQANYLVQFVAEMEPRLDRSQVKEAELSHESTLTLSSKHLCNTPVRVAIGISCGELERHKIPSPEWLADLAVGLAREEQIELVIPASHSDQTLIERLKHRLAGSIKTTVLIDLPVDQLLFHLESCTLGVSGTTGQGHMMAAANLPMLVLAGVTNPFESGPYVTRALILSHQFACGPCYQKYYVKGCGKISCMETLDVALGIRMATELLRDPLAGIGWRDQTKKQASIPVATIEALHMRPISEWTRRNAPHGFS